MYYSQEEIVNILHEEDIYINKRQIKYWRDIGLIPKLERIGTEWLYNDDIVNKIKEICISKGLYKQKPLCLINISNQIFTVYSINIKRIKENIVYTLFTNKGIVVRRK